HRHSIFVERTGQASPEKEERIFHRETRSHRAQSQHFMIAGSICRQYQIAERPRSRSSRRSPESAGSRPSRSRIHRVMARDGFMRSLLEVAEDLARASVASASSPGLYARLLA